MSLKFNHTDENESIFFKPWHFSNIFNQKSKCRSFPSKRQKFKSFFQYYFDFKTEKEKITKYQDKSIDVKVGCNDSHGENTTPNSREVIEPSKTITNSLFTKIRNISSSFKSITPDYTFPKYSKSSPRVYDQTNSSTSSKYDDLSIRKKIRKRLSQKSLGKKSQDVESIIPSEIVTTITECLFDQRTIETVSDTSVIDLDLRSEVSILSQEDQINFSPIYNSRSKTPPQSLPIDKHAKWKRSQMLRKAVADFDHNKWKSSHSIYNPDEKSLQFSKYNKSGNFNTFTDKNTSSGSDFAPENINLFYPASYLNDTSNVKPYQIKTKANTKNHKIQPLMPTKLSSSYLNNQNFSSINNTRSKRNTIVKKETRSFTSDQICYPLKKNSSLKANIVNPHSHGISNEMDFQF